MFEIDLHTPDEGTWFQFQESHFDQKKGEFVFDPPNSDAKVRVRPLNDFVAEQVLRRKQIREIVLNPKTGRMEAVSYLEDITPEQNQKETEDGFDYMITGIENFKDKKTGEIIKCTRENKIALMKIPAFDRFIGHCIRILSGIENEIKEAEKKT